MDAHWISVKAAQNVGMSGRRTTNTHFYNYICVLHGRLHTSTDKLNDSNTHANTRMRNGKQTFNDIWYVLLRDRCSMHVCRFGMRLGCSENWPGVYQQQFTLA